MTENLLILLLYLFLSGYIFTLIVLTRALNRIKIVEKSQNQPFVSVVICAHNEERNLPDCLKRLEAQQYPHESVEFIIVNDRSRDRTQEIIQKYTDKDKRFKSITIEDRIPDFAPKKRAIDMAIRQARGEIILLSDADGRPGPEWVKSMAAYFSADTDMVLGYAPYTVKPAGHFAKKILALEYLSHATVAAASTGLGYPATCVGTNMAYRRELYFEIGGFGKFKAHISGDDDLFLTRVREAVRYKIKYATEKETHVYNNPPQLWRKFVHQRTRYASKGLDYPLKMKAGLFMLFIFNLLLFSGLVAVFFNLKLFTATLPAFLLKGIFEFVLIRKAGKTLRDSRNLHLFPVAFLMHIPYLLFFSVLGQFKQFRWAEEKSEPAVQTQIPETPA